MSENRLLRVFLCHASEDKPRVRDLSIWMKTEGWIDPWLDEEKISPGQDWQLEIENAVDKTDVVIVCISKNSVSKEGYVQKEIKIVLDKADEKPDGTVFIIPLRFDDSDVPKRLSKWQWENGWEDNWETRLLESLKLRAQDKEITTMPPIRYGELIVLKNFLTQHEDLENFVVALRRAEGLYSEGRWPNKWVDLLVIARRWFDEKRTRDGGIISKMRMGGLKAVYDIYRDLLESKNHEPLFDGSRFISYPEQLIDARNHYELESNSAAKLYLDRAIEILAYTPNAAAQYLYNSLQLPFTDDDAAKLRSRLKEIEEEINNRDYIVGDFIKNGLTFEERDLIFRLVKNNWTLQQTAYDLNLNLSMASILFEGVCSKLRDSLKVEQVNITNINTILGPYIRKTSGENQ